MNTNQEITKSEESIDLQTRFDEALYALGNAVAAVTAITQARDVDEATRSSAMSVATDALDAAYDAFKLAVSRFRNETKAGNVVVDALEGAQKRRSSNTVRSCS